jgi:hypothetical protein
MLKRHILAWLRSARYALILGFGFHFPERNED